MPATNKVGTQLLVSPHLRDRARALAIVRHERVAEVWRAAIEGKGLAGLERTHAEELSRLHAVLNQFGALDPKAASKEEMLEGSVRLGVRLEALEAELERLKGKS